MKDMTFDKGTSNAITIEEWHRQNPDAVGRVTPRWLVSGTRLEQMETPRRETPPPPPRRTAADCAFPVEEPPPIRPLVIRRKNAPEGARES
jgi:hypothetical protein